MEDLLYLPPLFTERDRDVLLAHIERCSFGLLVSYGASGLYASHIPFLLARDGERVLLQGHLALPNPQGAALACGGEVLAIFPGPHSYISPS